MSAIRKKKEKKKNNSVTVTLSTNALCVSLEGLECTITAWVCFHIHEGVILGRTEASHGNDRNWKQTLCLSRLSCSLRGSRQWRRLVFVVAEQRQLDGTDSLIQYLYTRCRNWNFCFLFLNFRLEEKKKKKVIYCCWKIKTVFSRADARSGFWVEWRETGRWFSSVAFHISTLFFNKDKTAPLCLLLRRNNREPLNGSGCSGMNGRWRIKRCMWKKKNIRKRTWQKKKKKKSPRGLKRHHVCVVCKIARQGELR